MNARPETSQSTATSSAFLDSIEVKREPAELLAQFFLMAADQAAQRGIFLELGTFDDLLAVNQANQDSWSPLTSTFCPGVAGSDDSNGYVVLGRDQNGRVVTTHAVRRFDWQGTTLKEEAESLRLFYSDPSQKSPGEFFRVFAPEAEEITGTVAYTGGVWIHPDVRGGGRAQFIARAARALALARWDVDWVCSLYSPGTVQKKFYARTGYRDVILDASEAGYSPIASDSIVKLALVRTTPLALIDDLFGLMLRVQTERTAVEVDGTVNQRSA